MLKKSGALDFAILSATTAKTLEERFASFAGRVYPDGMLWVSWPKKTSKMGTDLSEDVVRRIGIVRGMVDVKVCAVDEICSGLKFVYRLKDRKGRR